MIFWRSVGTKMATYVEENLNFVRDQITKAWEQRCINVPGSPKPELVAVSKLQPAESIVAAYLAGQRHFGENYIQELLEKVNNPLIKEQCPDIKWHFIGKIQRNKVNKLFTFPIHLIQSVDSLKIIDHIDSSLKGNEIFQTPFKILLQVNTSGEETKGGIDPESVCEYVKRIKDSCPRLQFYGLMTIGEQNVDPNMPNPDFQMLVKLHYELDRKGISPSAETQLSMGMSGDYEEAITMGSTIVRVGSAIFGARPPKPQKETTLETHQ